MSSGYDFPIKVMSFMGGKSGVRIPPLLLGNLGVSGALPTSRNHGWRMSGTCVRIDGPTVHWSRLKAGPAARSVADLAGVATNERECHLGVHHVMFAA